MQFVAQAPSGSAFVQSKAGHSQLQPSHVFVTSRSPRFVLDLHCATGTGVPQAVLGSSAVSSSPVPLVPLSPLLLVLPEDDPVVPLLDADASEKSASKSFAQATKAIAKPEKARAIAARVMDRE